MENPMDLLRLLEGASGGFDEGRRRPPFVRPRVYFSDGNDEMRAR